MQLDPSQITILTRVGETGELSREELVTATGLTRQTISTKVQPLLDSGYLDSETLAAPALTGRPTSMLRLTDKAGFAVAIDIGHDLVRVGVASPDGRLQQDMIHEDKFEVDASPREGLRQALSMLSPWLDGRWSEVRGIAVGIPAPVVDSVAAPSLTTTWTGIDVADELVTGLVGITSDIPEVVVGNDANLAALGELRWGAAHGYEHVLFVKASAGVGAALIFDGRLYRGASGLAGEVGHTPPVPLGALALDETTRERYIAAPTEPRICSRCGKPGCLEVVASAGALPRRLLQRPEYAKHANTSFSASDIIANAVENPMAHGLCRDAINVAGHYIGATIASLVNVLDPQVIVVGGILSDAGSLFLGPIAQEVRLREVTGGEPRPVVLGEHRTNSVLMGGVQWIMSRVPPIMLRTEDFLSANAA